MRILSVGRGFIGKYLGEHENIDVVSHKASFDLSPYDAVINTAGIVGDRKCQKHTWQEIEDANISIPDILSFLAMQRGIPFFQLSTTGMYQPQSCPELQGFEKPTETSEIAIYNTYVESKVRAEEQIESEAYILRLPLFSDELAVRAKNWQFVQDTYLSLINRDVLLDVIFRFLKRRPELGIYNVATRVIHLPTHLKRMGIELPIRTEVPETMTSAVPIDTKKYERI